MTSALFESRHGIDDALLGRIALHYKLVSQAQLTQAETALAQAHFQAHTASAQLDLALGADFK